jgi:hypothetical protein
MSEREMVDHPAHYRTKGGWEVIDVIEAWDLDFCLGNAVKYLLRHRKKHNPVQDLAKCEWYVSRIVNAKCPPPPSNPHWLPDPEHVAREFGLNSAMSQVLLWIHTGATSHDHRLRFDALNAAVDILETEQKTLRAVLVAAE